MDPGVAPHADGRLVRNSAKRFWVAKLCLRVVSSVLCLVLIGVAAGLIQLSSFGGLLLLPQACVVLLWDAAEMITLVARRRPAYKGIHPGACVGVDLILWLGLTAGVVLTAPFIGPYSRRLRVASVAVAILLAVVQIVLFSIACHETRRRNSQPKTAHYNPPQPLHMAPQPVMRCATCAPGMICPACAPGMGYPAPATGWQYKPELAGLNTQPAPYPVGAPLVQQHEMPAVATSPPRHEMWTGNAPRYEMYVQNGGHGARQELAPQ